MISIEVCVGIEAFCHNYSGYEICILHFIVERCNCSDKSFICAIHILISILYCMYSLY